MDDSTLTDPLGRVIVLHDRTWARHILKGHPELKDARALAERAVVTPEAIFFSSSGPSARLFAGPGPHEGLRIIVVADVQLGLVKTAYFARRAPTGVPEWSSPKPSKDS